MTFDGRVEALIRVPAGVTVSATTDLGTSTVTIPTGSYFWTSAGGNTGLLATIAAQLNASAPPAAYPRTAAATNAAVGYGTWSAGWLLDELSGSLNPVFGGAALVPSGSPVYGNVGPRGGTDGAIAMSSVTDYLDGADLYNVSTTDDLAVLWVGKFSSLPTAYEAFFSRTAAAFANGWAIYAENTVPRIGMLAGASAAFAASVDGAAAFAVGQWHVGLSVIDRSTGQMRIATMPLAGGAANIGAQVPIVNAIQVASTFRVGSCPWQTGFTNLQVAALYVAFGSGAATGMAASISTVLTNFANAINAAWSASLSTGASGTGKVTLSLSGGATTQVWALSWTSTTLRDVSGFTADISAVGSSTGTKQARGLWVPDCPFTVKTAPRRAPKMSDLRTTTSPTGTVLGIVGNYFYRHDAIAWSHVPESRTWEQAATLANASWETFFNETQLGLGSTTWFKPCSPLQIYDHTGGLVGRDANAGAGLASGWQMTGMKSIDPARARGTNGWSGYYEIALPELVSSG